MLRSALLALALLHANASFAAEVVDATGRSVVVPAQVTRVLPAGPPAAVLLAALAPDLMLGWTSPVSDQARSFLSPAATGQPQVPRLTGREDVIDRIIALKPDLIVDYGSVSSRYKEMAQNAQQRTGVPVMLFDGSLREIPSVVRTLGALLHREQRAETLALLTESLLALPSPTGTRPRVVFARGENGGVLALPGAEAAEVFTVLGWQVLAPAAGQPAGVAAIRDLDPDILIFENPTMADTVRNADEWKTVRAVQEGRVYGAPAIPFGWLSEPPSINRLLGLAWLQGHEPVLLASLFHAVAYGRAPTPAQLQTVLGQVRWVKP